MAKPHVTQKTCLNVCLQHLSYSDCRQRENKYAGRYFNKKEFLYTIGRNTNQYSITQHGMEVPQKNRDTITT